MVVAAAGLHNISNSSLLAGDFRRSNHLPALEALVRFGCPQDLAALRAWWAIAIPFGPGIVSEAGSGEATEGADGSSKGLRGDGPACAEPRAQQRPRAARGRKDPISSPRVFS